MAEDQQPQVDLDDEAKALKLAQIKAEARKAIADATAGAATAGLYTPQSKPVAGETTVESSSGSLLNSVALRGLRNAADTIAERVEKVVGKDGCVLLVAGLDFAAGDAPAVEIEQRLERFDQRFAEANALLDAAGPPAAPAAPEGLAALVPLLGAGAMGMSLVGLAADLVGMFKTNYSVSGREATLGFDALAAVSARALARRGIRAFIDGFRSLEGSVTIGHFTSLVESRRLFEDRLLRFEAEHVTPTQEEIDALTKQIAATTAPADIEALETRRRDLRTPDFIERSSDVAVGKALIAAFDQYATGITGVPQGEQYSPLVAAALREVLHTGVDDEKATHILYLAVTAAGGDEVTRSGLFRDNRRLGLVGACEVTYVLIDKAGLVLASDSISNVSMARLDLESGRIDWDPDSDEAVLRFPYGPGPD